MILVKHDSERDGRKLDRKEFPTNICRAKYIHYHFHYKYVSNRLGSVGITDAWCTCIQLSVLIFEKVLCMYDCTYSREFSTFILLSNQPYDRIIQSICSFLKKMLREVGR